MTAPEFRADLMGQPAPDVPPFVTWPAERCRAEDVPDGYICTAEKGHAGPHAAYSRPDHLCHTWPQAGRVASVATAGQPPAELDNVGGRGGFAGYQTVPTFTCGRCGTHGTMPSHPECRRYYLTELRADPNVAAAREAYRAYQDATDAALAARGTPAFDELNHAADRAQLALAGHLHWVLMMLDAAAGQPLTGSAGERGQAGAR